MPPGANHRFHKALEATPRGPCRALFDPGFPLELRRYPRRCKSARLARDHQGNFMLKRLMVALLACSALGGASQAWAQADATPQTSDTAPKTVVAGLEKVVVTARKRQEDEQVVPISITA